MNYIYNEYSRKFKKRSGRFAFEAYEKVLNKIFFVVACSPIVRLNLHTNIRRSVDVECFYDNSIRIELSLIREVIYILFSIVFFLTLVRVFQKFFRPND